jgi:hypothetical protein
MTISGPLRHAIEPELLLLSVYFVFVLGSEIRALGAAQTALRSSASSTRSGGASGSEKLAQTGYVLGRHRWARHALTLFPPHT